MSQTGAFDRHKHSATSDGSLDLYVKAKTVKRLYKVSFRVPGANTGTS